MANLEKSLRPDLRIAVAGLGAIGTRVVEALDRGIDGLVLTAVSVQNPEKHRSRLAGLTRPPAILPIEALVDVADIVIECAPSKLVRSIVAPFVSAGKTAVVLSAGALLDHEDLIELAKQHGGQIVVPTGALIGLDAVTAAAVGTIHSVRMITRKPPARARRRSLYRRQQHRPRRDHRTAQDIRRHGARGGKRISGQCECCRRAVAGRDRSRSNDDRDLGRSRRDAQHAPDRGGFQFRPLFDVDREHPVGEPEDRSASPRSPSLPACASCGRRFASEREAQRFNSVRHARACPGHPRLAICARRRGWPGQARP